MSDQTSEPDMPAMPAATHAYFATGAEQRRFEQNPLEFERHKQIFSERLPTEGHVLDVGGGPGAYASLLASQGYEVDLIDPVPLHIEQAQDAARRGPAFDAGHCWRPTVSFDLGACSWHRRWAGSPGFYL